MKQAMLCERCLLKAKSLTPSLKTSNGTHCTHDTIPSPYHCLPGQQIISTLYRVSPLSALDTYASFLTHTEDIPPWAPHLTYFLLSGISSWPCLHLSLCSSYNLREASFVCDHLVNPKHSIRIWPQCYYSQTFMPVVGILISTWNPKSSMPALLRALCGVYEQKDGWSVLLTL